jgi:hypothetical protein
MGFLYETHLHTSEASACAVSSGAEYIGPYLDRGFTGIIVTDHFFNSNTALDRRLPWAEWVKGFCAGYEKARNEGLKRGLDVFFGWEETFDGDDYLVYGLDRAWLLEHPEVVRWTRKEQFREVRRYGGCVVHAHPFRQHPYIGTVNLAPRLVDAVEAANAGNHEAAYDGQAREYARILGLPAAAGSDIHDTADIAAGPFGVELEKPLASIKDYTALIREKQNIGLYIPPGRCDFCPADSGRLLTLKVKIHGNRNTDGGQNSGGGNTSGGRRMRFSEVMEQIAAAASMAP